MPVARSAAAEKKQAFSLYEAGRLAEARAVCESCTRHHPDDPEIWCLLASISGALGSYTAAEQYARRALTLLPEYSLARFNLAVALLHQERTVEALAAFEELLRVQPDHGMAHFLAGKCSERQPGRLKEALAHYEKAAGLLANPPRELLLRLGPLYEKNGELEKARAWVEELLRAMPADPGVQQLMARLEMREDKLESARARLEALRDSDTLGPGDRAGVMNRLGKVLDRLGEYRKAWEAFEEGQRITGRDVEQGRGKFWFDRISRNQAVTTTENVARWRLDDPRDDLPSPAFLIGFPRSGTTLTERIIASHPGVTASSEDVLINLLVNELDARPDRRTGYPYCLNDLGRDEVAALRRRYWDLARTRCGAEPGERLFLDKMPLNLIELCLVNRIFPRAKILFLLRDPRDVCLSCFMQSFDLNDAMVNFLDLDSTARFYDAAMRLWDHYQRVLDLDLLTVRYEDLVADLEPWARKILSFLDLDWDEGVLEYYRDHSHNITTPSYLDTCKPVYTRARGRWRNYQEQLQPVMERIQPHVEHFGYDPAG